MTTIAIEYSLGDPVQIRAIDGTVITGAVAKVVHGYWMSQPIQNRFYVLFDSPVNEIGEWYAPSQLLPNGTTSPGSFESVFDVDGIVNAPTPDPDVVAPSTCTQIHYGPMNTATVEVQYMLVYNDPQPMGTGRWHSLLELGA